MKQSRAAWRVDTQLQGAPRRLPQRPRKGSVERSPGITRSSEGVGAAGIELRSPATALLHGPTEEGTVLVKAMRGHDKGDLLFYWLADGPHLILYREWKGKPFDIGEEREVLWLFDVAW